MNEKKVKAGQIIVSHNPLFPGFNGNIVAFPGEETMDFGEKNTAVFTAEELFNDLKAHNTEEFREFIEKRVPAILERREKRHS